MVMLSPDPVPGPVSAGTAGTDWEGPCEASVELLPLGRSSCTPLHPLATIQFWLVTGQVTVMGLGGAGCPALLKA